MRYSIMAGHRSTLGYFEKRGSNGSLWKYGRLFERLGVMAHVRALNQEDNIL